MKGNCVLETGLFVALSLIPGAARADLAHGTVNLRLGGFDFSEQRQYPFGIENIDIAWCVVSDPPIGDQLCIWNYAGILAVPDTLLEDVTWAPPDVSEYEPYGVPIQGMVYILKTGDGLYVKFVITRFASFSYLDIEYYVQMDGTNNLSDDIIVAVEPITWGRVKTLYR